MYDVTTSTQWSSSALMLEALERGANDGQSSNSSASNVALSIAMDDIFY
jgi:hypothetical protein